MAIPRGLPSFQPGLPSQTGCAQRGPCPGVLHPFLPCCVAWQTGACDQLHEGSSPFWLLAARVLPAGSSAGGRGAVRKAGGVRPPLPSALAFFCRSCARLGTQVQASCSHSQTLTFEHGSSLGPVSSGSGNSFPLSTPRTPRHRS